MSLSYAARLTQNVDYGECGLAEKEDTPRVKEKEMSKLIKFLFVCAFCLGFAYLLVWIFKTIEN